MREKLKWSSLYFSQFLSAFADNAVFFALVGILHKQGIHNTDNKMAGYQLMFLLAYVVLAPIVGAMADKNPKRNILMLGNLFKAIGAVLLFTDMDPGLAYGLVGVGAVIYSPAKYGILSEFTDNKQKLLTANGIMEGSTILAILLGTVVGGMMADNMSVTANLTICALIYTLALVMAIIIPRVAGDHSVRYGKSATGFFKDVGVLLKNNNTRFSLFGTASFWMISAVIRIGFLTWLAEHLDINTTSQQSMMVGTTAVGVVVGALLAPIWIKTHQTGRVRVVGFAIGLSVIAALFSPNVPTIITALVLIGVLGG
jgi:LPLT family lysophospholipid transporter-like MFS transporter